MKQEWIYGPGVVFGALLLGLSVGTITAPPDARAQNDTPAKRSGPPQSEQNGGNPRGGGQNASPDCEQGPPPPPGEGGCPPGPCPKGKAVGPLLERLTFRLDLTDEQEDALEPIFEADHKAHRAIMEELGVKPPTRPTREQMESVKDKLEAIDADTRTKIEAILTPDQIVKLKKAEKKKCKKRPAPPQDGGQNPGDDGGANPTPAPSGERS